MKPLFLLLLFPLVLLSGAVSAHAATVTIDGPSSFSVGTQAPLYVSLTTNNDIVNAIAGKILVPDILEVVDIRFTGSVVPLWVESPHIVDGNVLTFAGVLPGGYVNGAYETTAQGNLFTLVVEGRKDGSGVVAISPETSAYANDGAGSEIPTTHIDADVMVGGTVRSDILTSDRLPPESIETEVIPGSLVGQTGDVLIYIAHDKDSAIGTYSVARSIFPFAPPFMTYRIVSSPLPLSFFDRVSFIHIRATDTAGNQRTKTIAPYGISASFPLTVVVILTIVLLTPLRRFLYAMIKKR